MAGDTQCFFVKFWNAPFAKGYIKSTQSNIIMKVKMKKEKDGKRK